MISCDMVSFHHLRRVRCVLDNLILLYIRAPPPTLEPKAVKITRDMNASSRIMWYSVIRRPVHVGAATSLCVMSQKPCINWCSHASIPFLYECQKRPARVFHMYCVHICSVWDVRRPSVRRRKRSARTAGPRRVTSTPQNCGRWEKTFSEDKEQIFWGCHFYMYVHDITSSRIHWKFTHYNTKDKQACESVEIIEWKG